MSSAVRAASLGGTNGSGLAGVIVLGLLALLALPNLSQGAEAAPALRKHVLSGGVGLTLGAIGAKYTYRFHERGPTVSAGTGVLGYSLELGFPVHRARSKPTRELFVYAGVLEWQSRYLDPGFWDVDEGSHSWVIGLGPRLWPDQGNRVYVAGAAELLLSREPGGWGSLSLEGGVGF